MNALKPEWEQYWHTDITVIKERLSKITTHFIGQGIGSGDYPWFTLQPSPKNNGSSKRVVSKFLPLRPTREEAERDLYCWLELWK